MMHLLDIPLTLACLVAFTWALWERWERQRLQEIVDERTDEMLAILKAIEDKHKDEP